MYERFTERARRVMQIATQEAQRFNHEYLDTSHILLGLLIEGSGAASHELKKFGLYLYQIGAAINNAKVIGSHQRYA